MTTVSPSTTVPTFTGSLSSPKVNHVRSVRTASRMAGASPCSSSPPAVTVTCSLPCSALTVGRSRNWTPTTTERTKAMPTRATPMCQPPPGNRFPKKRVSQNEANVSAGMIQTCSSTSSALHEVDLVEVHRGPVAVDEQDDGEADADLGGGD